MTGTNQNFDSEQWNKHVETYKAAVRRVTPPPSGGGGGSRKNGK